MNEKIEIINPINSKIWDDILNRNDCLPFFYTSDWANVLIKTYKYKPLYFISYSNNKVQAYLPIMEVNSFLTGKRAVSLPFSDTCELFFNSKKDFNKLFNHILLYGKRNNWKSIELRGGQNFLKTSISYSKYYEHLLNLNRSIESIFNNFRDNVKRNIKQAQNKYVKVDISQSYTVLKRFIYLNVLTRKRHGLPPQPDKFFKNLYNYIISKKTGYIVSANYNNKIIAVSIFIIKGRNVLFKYNASDMKYQKLRANNLIMWEAIKYFNENNYKYLSLGRTHPDNIGLLQFKKGFNCDIETVYYYKYNLKKGSYIGNDVAGSNFINIIFKNMPLFLLKITGTFLYKHFA